LITKYDKKYYTPNIPRFSQADLEKSVLKNSDIKITEHTTLGDMWKHRSKTTMVSLEEVCFNRWYNDRLVLLGDAVHKVTPNAGHGGNTAIESAAVLANLLYEAKMGTTKGFSLSHEGLLNVFREYQDSRLVRSNNAVNKSSMATRLQAMDNILWKTGALRIIPMLGESMEVNAASALIMGGEPLKFVEYKGKQGSIPWEGWEVAELGDVEKRSFFDSILGYSVYVALPLLLVWYIQQSSTWSSTEVPMNSNLDGSMANGTIQAGMPPRYDSEFLSKNVANTWSLFSACLEIIAIGLMMAVEGARANDPRRVRFE
jgi:FAD dependent monooxygenase